LINSKLPKDIYNDELSEVYIAVQAPETGRIQFKKYKNKRVLN